MIAKLVVHVKNDKKDEELERKREKTTNHGASAPLLEEDKLQNIQCPPLEHG